MTTQKQREAAKENIKKAQEAWQNMSSRQRSLAQPEGREREKPGRGGEGDYYHVGVRDKNDFETFRTHDVGDEGGLQRVAGKRSSGSWDTVKWLISKDFAHVEDGKLIPDHDDAKDLLDKLGSEPKPVKGDMFEAKPHPNVPEKDKSTEAQKKARQENIKKAQKARHGDDGERVVNAWPLPLDGAVNALGNAAEMH